MLKLNFGPPSNRICVTIDSSDAPFAVVNFHGAACFVWTDVRHPNRDYSLSSKQYARYSPSDVPTRRYFRYSIASVYTPRQTLPPFTRPHVGMNYTRRGRFQFPRDPPLRALLIPRGASFPCTQNASLRAVGVPT